MKRVRVRIPAPVETTLERRDRIAPILDLNPRDRDVVRAKATGAGTAWRYNKQAH